ncbi:MAG: VWA domain-containing protein [Ignavibacteria bacterium]|nr:VWA domain-containing protein [Ignavibacteria bacterium]
MSKKIINKLYFIFFFSLVIPLLYSGCRTNDNNPVIPPPPVTSLSSVFSVMPVDKQYVAGNFSVKDQNNNPVTGLQSVNITAALYWSSKNIKDSCNGNVNISSNNNRKIAAALTMDYSGSMGLPDGVYIRMMKSGVRTYISAMHSNDIAEIIKYDDDVVVVCPLTSDKLLLNRAVDSLDYNFSGLTSLYQSITQAVNDVAAVSDSQFIRTVVAFTDGIEGSSGITRDSMIKSAKRNAIPVYSVGFYNDTAGQYGWKDLKNISDTTGAFVFWADSKDTSGPGLNNIYSKIYKLLSESYSIKIEFPCGSTIPSGTLCEITFKVTYYNNVCNYYYSYLMP